MTSTTSTIQTAPQRFAPSLATLSTVSDLTSLSSSVIQLSGCGNSPQPVANRHKANLAPSCKGVACAQAQRSVAFGPAEQISDPKPVPEAGLINNSMTVSYKNFSSAVSLVQPLLISKAKSNRSEASGRTILMLERQERILTAEPDANEATRLTKSLSLLGYQVELARAPEEVLALIRSNIFSRAIVAMELSLDGENILARLAQLPSMKCLIATGPAKDLQAETNARLAGANLYLPRPVNMESLAQALWEPAPRKAISH